MTSHMTEFLDFRALVFKHNQTHLMSGVLDEADLSKAGKQVCTILSNEATERLESMLKILDLSKRKFIEMAILHALDEADRILVDRDVFGELL